MNSRLELVTRVCSLLAAGSNVAIHASPGAGKTWTADAVGAGLADCGVDVIRLDMSTRDDGAAILHDLRKHLDSDDSTVEPGTSTYGAWGDLSTTLRTQAKRVVLILDEFDSVVDFPDGLGFLRLLRELMHRPQASNCNALIVSRRPLDAIEKQVRGISTLASVCYAEYLGAVTEADLREAGWETALELALGEREACLTWAAGHANLVQYWLAVRPDIRPSESCDLQQAATMQRLVEYLDGLGLLNAAAQLVLGPVVDDWLRERKQLVALGVIAPLAELERNALSTHDVFRDVLRRRTWDLNPWGILGQAEIRLRALVEAVLLDARGPTWAQQIISGNRAVADAHRRAREKQERDERQFGRPGTWLAYTYPNDLGVIISSQWTSFAGIFDTGDKAYWRVRFEGLGHYRAPMAHNRVESLSDDQRVQCRIWSDEILRRIDAFEMGSAVGSLT